jgi:hypothetical protein
MGTEEGKRIMRIRGEIMADRHCIGKIRERVRNQTPEEFEHNFWSKVAAGPNCCILWTGTKTTRGYGMVWCPKSKTQKRTHRVAYELHFKRNPGRFEVCHTCDNPPCINPNHLFLGTHTKNMRDMTFKGRNKAWKGESNGQHKLTEAEVISIRRKYIPRIYGTIKLAREFGVSQALIMQIIHRKAWKHI